MAIITTKRSYRRIGHIARHGKKRQRAKYRHALTLCSDGVVLGKTCKIDDRKVNREERRRGVFTPVVESGRLLSEPMWHGVKGRRGCYWTLHETHRDAWVGRTD